jgi:NTP pyrophosphatase (non-canonical NTP hydrolase)
MHLSGIQRIAWDTAEEKGLHDALRHFSEDEKETMIRLALIHTEISEALQEVKRHGLTAASLPRIASELSDTLIRIGDLAQCLGIDLTHYTLRTLERNTERPHGYGTPWETVGGVEE